MTLESRHDSSLAVFLRQAVKDSRPGPRVLYRSLALGLRQAIAEGVVEVGAVLPGERELGEQIGVSRTSVRKAMERLVDEGVLIRRQGARTAIAERVEKPMASLTSFSEDMRWRGLEPGMVWLSSEVAVASPSEVMALNLSVGQTVSRLGRLRTGDGKPMAIEHAAVPTDILPDPAEVLSSLYEVMGRRGFRPVRALQRLRAATATAEDARLLDLEPGAALLVAERRCFGRNGRPVEFTQTRYCGDRYDFVAELKATDDRAV